MDDDGGDWFTDAGDEPEVAPAATAAAAGGGARKASAAGAPAGDGGEGEAPAGEQAPEAEEEYLDPDKLILFKHWIRPKFLQYKYLYDYRRNYYDDVIDFLDKRQKGLSRDIPHAQTWGERVLRTYNSKVNRVESFRKLVDDTKLVTKTQLSGSFHIYHSRSYINRRYSSILA